MQRRPGVRLIGSSCSANRSIQPQRRIQPRIPMKPPRLNRYQPGMEVKEVCREKGREGWRQRRRMEKNKGGREMGGEQRRERKKREGLERRRTGRGKQIDCAAALVGWLPSERSSLPLHPPPPLSSLHHRPERRKRGRLLSQKVTAGGGTPIRPARLKL